MVMEGNGGSIEDDEMISVKPFLCLLYYGTGWEYSTRR